MYGAILGDIAGSRFEFSRPNGFDWKTTDFFGGMSTYTDDTVLTVATKYAVLTGTPYGKAYALFGKFDLTVMPYITETDRKGLVIRKYVSLTL